ncbi:cytochrome c3 family protein [Novosphingobium colocasiae]|uniref:cytochrome c3 family protein n=1 Tax=Novosphingobium colocasiae TaxID=1256513 RepID=UPI0035B1883F
MTFRIREIKRTAAGREIVRDRDLPGDTLSIGRAAENDLHLPDLAVEPRHARITLNDAGRLSVAALGSLGFVVDGVDARAASVDSAVGAELGFGTWRITVSRDADGTVLLTLRQADDAATRSGDLEQKRGLSLTGVLPGKRAMSWLLAIAILIGFLAVPVISNLTRDRAAKGDAVIGDRSWNPGALSLAHHSLTGKCEACHVKPFEPVRDATCLSCHKDLQDHADPKRLAAAHGKLAVGDAALWSIAHAFGKEGPGACRDCHAEHQGQTRMAPPAQQFCADCHSRLKENLPDTALGDASDFGLVHPELTALVTTDPLSQARRAQPVGPGLREDNGLSFAHRLHLDPRGGVARMAASIGAMRGYGSGGLQCKDCHRPTEDGVRFQPVKMERDCEGCHSLAYDRVGGVVRKLHHGDVPQLMADLWAADWHRASPMAGLIDGRRRPGSVGQAMGVSGPFAFRYPAPVRPGLSVGAALSKQGICGECHRPATIKGQPGVVPVRQPARYMMHGWFDHADHKQEKCTSCHAAAKSDTAADVMLPDLKSCRTCHAGEDAAAPKVPSTCAMCHGYHTVEHGSDRRDRAGG